MCHGMGNQPGFEAVTIADQAHTFAQDKVHCQEKEMIIIDGMPLNVHGKMSLGCVEGSNLGP